MKVRSCGNVYDVVSTGHQTLAGEMWIVTDGNETFGVMAWLVKPENEGEKVMRYHPKIVAEFGTSRGYDLSLPEERREVAEEFIKSSNAPSGMAASTIEWHLEHYLKGERVGLYEPDGTHTPLPVAGDVVRIASPWGWANHSAPVGSLGFIDMIPDAHPYGGRIMFGGREGHPWSGHGPGTIHTSFSELRSTNETMTWVRDITPSGGLSRERTTETRTVRVWDWHPSNNS